MKHVFEKDADNATINPLYIQKNTSVETTTTETNIKLSYHWIIFRAILFLIIPIIVLWFTPYHTLYVYIWICYVLLAQATMIFNIIDENNNNIYKRLVIFVTLFVLISIIISIIPDTMVHTKETHLLKNNYQSCEWYTKKDLQLCDGFFGNDASKILATPTTTNGGESLKRETILKIMMLGNSFQDDIQSSCPILPSLVCQSLLSPCSSTCQPSKLSSTWCTDTINRKCLQTSGFEDINILFSYTLLPDPKDNEILRHLLNQTYTHYLNADKTSQTSLCNDPNFFTTSVLSSTSYNCTDSNVIPGSTYFTSNKTTILQIVYTLFTILVFVWLSMYRSKYMKQRRDYTLSELVQIIGCVIFMIMLLIRLFMSMNQLLSQGIVFHIFGLIAMYVSFMIVDIICSLGGKKPIHAMLEYANIFQHYYALFEALTNIRDGKYYFHYIIIFEIVEITLQLFTFNAMIRQNDVLYVLFASLIISLNFIGTPLGFIAIRYRPALGRKVTYITDTVLETMYLFLNLSFTTKDNLLDVGILLSLLIPLGSLVMKISSFVEYTSTYETNQARRESWIQHQLNYGRRSGPRAISMSRNKQLYIYIIISSIMIILGFTMFGYMLYSIISVTQICEQKLGQPLWEGAYPRRVFFDGVMKFPSCHLETIEVINATNKKIQELTPAIGECSSLKRLFLSNNDIVKVPLEMLKLPKDVKIDLSNNPVWYKFDWDNNNNNGDELLFFPWFLEQFISLKIISLNNNKIESIPSFVSVFNKLETLSMKNNSLNSLPAELTSVPSLYNFYVNHNPVSKSLVWHGTKNRIIGMRILNSMNTTLEYLDVSFGEFITSDVEMMMMYPRLIYLNVSSNQMNAFRSVSSSDFLYLNVLDISNNPIIDVQEDVFYTYRNLTVVRMSNLQDSTFAYRNAPDDYSIKMLESYFQSNIILQLEFSGKKFVSFCSIGVELNMLGIQYVNKLGWNCFGRFEGMRSLGLTYNNIDDNDCGFLGPALKEMKVMTTLSLGANKITDIGIEKLVPALKEMKGMTHLYLKNIKITDIGIEKLVPALKEMKVMTYLGLGNNKITDIGIEKLVPALKEMKGMTHLYLGNNKITDIGIEKLVPALREMKGMIYLELDNNNITDIGIEKLVPALKEMKIMTRLGLTYNKITDIGIEKLVPALKEMKGMTGLHLSHNKITDIGIEKLVPALKEMKGMTRLELDHNNITDIGIEKLVPALKEMKGMTRLDLNNNKITDIGIEKLVPALKEMKVMSTLDLTYNKITDIGIEKLVPALKEMKGMTSLELGSNKITDISIEKLVPALKEMKGMTWLWLKNNNITNAGKNQILEVCKSYKNVERCAV